MAELPDLTVFAQILSPRFMGKTLKEIDFIVAKKLKVWGQDRKVANWCWNPFWQDQWQDRLLHL